MRLSATPLPRRIAAGAAGRAMAPAGPRAVAEIQGLDGCAGGAPPQRRRRLDRGGLRNGSRNFWAFSDELPQPLHRAGARPGRGRAARGRAGAGYGAVA